MPFRYDGITVTSNTILTLQLQSCCTNASAKPEGNEQGRAWSVGHRAQSLEHRERGTAQRVHGIKYTIKSFFGIDYEKLAANIAASKQISQAYVINFVSDEIRRMGGVEKSRYFKRKIKDLKQFRVESEYVDPFHYIKYLRCEPNGIY